MNYSQNFQENLLKPDRDASANFGNNDDMLKRAQLEADDNTRSPPMVVFEDADA